MLSKSKIKVIQSLDKKKFRQKYDLFVIEGNKIIKEIKKSQYKIEELFCNKENTQLINEYSDAIIIENSDFKKISHLTNASNSLAIVKLKPNIFIESKKLQLVLDDIQDPGNLGTIIRLADWFGIEQIICSPNTCDFYNPKVIQASMGSFLRVNIFYTDLKVFLNKYPKPIISTAMNGKNIYKNDFSLESYLVLGNEGNGISSEILNLSDEIISIPQFNTHGQTESLNVAMATSILLSRFIGK